MAEEKDQETKTVPFYPDHITYEAKVALGFGILFVAVGVVGLINPLGLGPPADPMDTPAHAKPEWYFLFLYQLLKFIPETIGATAPVVGLFVLAILPFLDRRQKKTTRAMLIRGGAALIATLIIIGLSIWGEVS